MSDEARREKRALDKAAAVAEVDRTKWNALLSVRPVPFLLSLI